MTERQHKEKKNNNNNKKSSIKKTKHQQKQKKTEKLILQFQNCKYKYLENRVFFLLLSKNIIILQTLTFLLLTLLSYINSLNIDTKWKTSNSVVWLFSFYFFVSFIAFLYLFSFYNDNIRYKILL